MLLVQGSVTALATESVEYSINESDLFIDHEVDILDSEYATDLYTEEPAFGDDDAAFVLEDEGDELEVEEADELEVEEVEEEYLFEYANERIELLELNVTMTQHVWYGVMTTGGAFRVGPSAAYASMRTLTQGTELEVLGSTVDGRWLHVRIGTQVGFAFADSVRPTTRFGVMIAGGAFRVGPGTGHASMRTLTQGTELEILGSNADGRWLNVRVGSQEGFAFADSVSQGARMGVMSAGGAFRVGPGTGHASMRTLTQGTELELLGTSADGQWLRVRSGNQVGWAFAGSVSQGARMGVMTAGGAFRVGPGAGHTSMRTLTQGTELEILRSNADGRWLNVRIGNQVGWAFADSVRQTTRFGVMTAGGAFRVGPGAAHASMRTLTQGTELEILGSSIDGRWLRVRSNNQIGWAFADSVSQTTRLSVMRAGGAFRVGPSTAHASMRTLTQGTQVDVLGSSIDGRWLRVRSANQLGWAFADSVMQTTNTRFMGTGGAFRVGPGAAHASMRTLTQGTQVVVLGSSIDGRWLRVRSNNQIGWAFADSVTDRVVQPPQPQPQSTRTFDALFAYAQRYLGRRHVMGGNRPATGFDCSGFMQWIFSVHGVTIPRTAAAQRNAATSVSRANAQPGDLVFFSLSGGPIGHVGLYVGGGRMLHVSSSRGVVFDQVHTGWWASRFVSYGRVLR